MKIGIQTDLLDTTGYGRWKENMYTKLKTHGYDCTDFPMANTNTPIYSLPLEEAEELLLHEKSLANNAGIEIVQTHGPWRWPPKDSTSEDRAERMEKMKKAIYFTSLMGCKNCVIHPIMPYGIEDAGTENAQKTRELNKEFFTELLKEAHKYDVTICLENMPMHNFSLATPSDILGFIQEMNDEHLKICLDTGHISVFDNIDIYDEVLKVGDYIRAFHIHDNKCGVDLHLIPYFGIIDWDRFATALKDINYKGAFTLETIPSRNLPDPIFEEMCISLAKTAKYIVDRI